MKNLVKCFLLCAVIAITACNENEDLKKQTREVAFDVTSFEGVSTGTKAAVTVNASDYGAPTGVPSLFMTLTDDVEGDMYEDDLQFDFSTDTQNPSAEIIKANVRYGTSTVHAWAFQNSVMGESEYMTGNNDGSRDQYGYIYHERYNGNNNDGSVSDQDYTEEITGSQVHELLGGVFYKQFEHTGKLIIGDDAPTVPASIIMKPVNDMLAVDGTNNTTKFMFGYRIKDRSSDTPLGSYVWCRHSELYPNYGTRYITVFNHKYFTAEASKDLYLEVVIALTSEYPNDISTINIIESFEYNTPTFEGQQTWIKSIVLEKGFGGKEYELNVSFDKTWRDQVWDDNGVVTYDWN